MMTLRCLISETSRCLHQTNMHTRSSTKKPEQCKLYVQMQLWEQHKIHAVQLLYNMSIHLTKHMCYAFMHFSSKYRMKATYIFWR